MWNFQRQEDELRWWYREESWRKEVLWEGRLEQGWSLWDAALVRKERGLGGKGRVERRGSELGMKGSVMLS